jgi:methylated-DNA-[protein]-cysteine S-methyltransferase
MNTCYHTTFVTPVGKFSVAVDPAGAVVATVFGDTASLRSRLGKCHLLSDTSKTAAVREQVLAYFSGVRRTFNLSLAPSGTEFQQKVWAALRRIPFGETRTYRDLARELGSANASRAVGRANATNPICLIVPCHRVIGADGSLTGFAFGVDIKRALLAHEGTAAARAA